MKLDALQHPKTLDLAARLGVSLPTAIGHLELLWAFTAKHAPQGNIGKWPDGAIARDCHWMGDPEVFLQSLLQSRLLDACHVNRYVIHDWSEHAPRWVRAKLAKLKVAFVEAVEATADPPQRPTVVRTVVASSQGNVRQGSEDFSLAAQDGKPVTKKGTRVPEPFVVTSEMRKWADQNYPRLDIERATQSFVDYWKGVTGKDGTKLDWEATWRNGMTSRSEWRQLQIKQEDYSDPNRNIL